MPDTITEHRDRARLHCRSDGFVALRDYLLAKADEAREGLLVNRGHAADEMRGFVKLLRTALRHVDADERRRPNA